MKLKTWTRRCDRCGEVFQALIPKSDRRFCSRRCKRALGDGAYRKRESVGRRIEDKDPESGGVKDPEVPCVNESTRVKKAGLSRESKRSTENSRLGGR